MCVCMSLCVCWFHEVETPTDFLASWDTRLAWPSPSSVLVSAVAPMKLTMKPGFKMGLKLIITSILKTRGGARWCHESGNG